MELDKGKQCSAYGRRALKHRRENQVLMIEGESVTMAEVIRRSGLSASQVCKKMRCMQVVTWKGLGVVK